MDTQLQNTKISTDEYNSLRYILDHLTILVTEGVLPDFDSKVIEEASVFLTRTDLFRQYNL